MLSRISTKSCPIQWNRTGILNWSYAYVNGWVTWLSIVNLSGVVTFCVRHLFSQRGNSNILVKNRWVQPILADTLTQRQTYIQTHTDTQINTQTDTHTYTHTNMHTLIHIHTQSHTLALSLTHTHTNIHSLQGETFWDWLLDYLTTFFNLKTVKK